MAATLLLPALELAIDEMLRVCVGGVEAGQKPDPINFLATHLLRNNPPRRDGRLAARRAREAARGGGRGGGGGGGAAEAAKPHLSDEDAAVRLEVQRGHHARLVVQHKHDGGAAAATPRAHEIGRGDRAAGGAARPRQPREGRAPRRRRAPGAAAAAVGRPEGDSAVALQAVTRGQLSRSSQAARTRSGPNRRRRAAEPAPSTGPSPLRRSVRFYNLTYSVDLSQASGSHAAKRLTGSLPGPVGPHLRSCCPGGAPAFRHSNHFCRSRLRSRPSP